MTQKQKKTQVKSVALSMLVVAVMVLVTLTPATMVNAETKEIGGTLVVAIKEAPGTTNPLNATGDEWIMNVLYDSLAVYDPAKGVLPWMANDWTVKNNGTTVDVTLKNDITFTDGSPMTSADVVYSYEQYMSGTGYYHDQVACLKSVTAVNDYTVEFTLSAPNSNFFTKALMVPIIKSGTAADPVGTGPYMDYTDSGVRTAEDTNITLNNPMDAGSRQSGNVTYHLSHSHLVQGSVVVHAYAPLLNETGAFVGTNWSKENNHTVDVDYLNGTIVVHNQDQFEYVTVDFAFEQQTYSVQANRNYFAGSPYIGGMTFVMEYGKDSAAVDDINNGRVDVIFDMVDSYYKSVVKGMNSLTPMTTQTIELRMNDGSAPLNNSAFRKAISYAVDKEGFVSKTLLNGGVVADSVIPRDNVFWYNSSLEPRPYSTGLAASTLTAAGFVDSNGDGFREYPNNGTNIHLTVKSVGIATDNYLAAQAQVVSEILKTEVGIDNTWTIEPAKNITEDVQSGNFDMVMIRVNNSLDPSYLENFMTGNPNNYMHYSNATFDAVMQNASTTMDLTEKQKYIKQAQGILYDDTATIVLAYMKGLQYYNGSKYDGYYDMINGINNKFTLLNVYHVTEGKLHMSVVVSTPSPQSGTNVTIDFTVTDGSNLIKGATVYVGTSAGLISTDKITTDENGKASVVVTVPDVDALTDVTIWARAYMPGYVHAEASTTVTVHPAALKPLDISVDPTSAEVGTEEGNNTVTLTVTVTSDNTPVSGAVLDVSVLPSTGAKISVSGPTDENGHATITFTAPKTTERIIQSIEIRAHADGYADPDAPAVSSITVVGTPAEHPTADTAEVPGFSMFMALAALGLAGVAVAYRRKH